MLSPVLRRVDETARQGASRTGPLPLPLSLSDSPGASGVEGARVAKSLYLNMLIDGTLGSLARFDLVQDSHGFAWTQHDRGPLLSPLRSGPFQFLGPSGESTEPAILGPAQRACEPPPQALQINVRSGPARHFATVQRQGIAAPAALDGQGALEARMRSPAVRTCLVLISRSNAGENDS
jgi:hypothetical protein